MWTEKKVNEKNEPFAKLRPGFMRDNGHGLLREDKVNCGGKIQKWTKYEIHSNCEKSSQNCASI